MRASNRLLAEPMLRAGWGAATLPDLNRRMVKAWLACPLPSELAEETTVVADRQRSLAEAQQGGRLRYCAECIVTLKRSKSRRTMAHRWTGERRSTTWWQ